MALLSLITFLATIQDFGVQGQTLPVQERSMRELIEERLQAKPLPPPKLKLQSLALRKATSYRRFQIDPTICADEDIFDHEGKQVVVRGSCINPLKKVQPPLLLFFDARDEDQLNWARNENEEARWVLVAGDPFKLEEEEERPIYFDQGASLINHFGIEAVPARVSTLDAQFLVEEFSIDV